MSQPAASSCVLCSPEVVAACVLVLGAGLTSFFSWVYYLRRRRREAWIERRKELLDYLDRTLPDLAADEEQGLEAEMYPLLDALHYWPLDEFKGHVDCNDCRDPRIRYQEIRGKYCGRAARSRVSYYLPQFARHAASQYIDAWHKPHYGDSSEAWRDEIRKWLVWLHYALLLVQFNADIGMVHAERGRDDADYERPQFASRRDLILGHLAKSPLDIPDCFRRGDAMLPPWA